MINLNINLIIEEFYRIYPKMINYSLKTLEKLYYNRFIFEKNKY